MMDKLIQVAIGAFFVVGALIGFFGDVCFTGFCR